MLTKPFSNLFYVLKPAGLIAIGGPLPDLYRDFVLSGFRPITRLHACKKAPWLVNLAANDPNTQELLKGME